MRGYFYLVTFWSTCYNTSCCMFTCWLVCTSYLSTCVRAYYCVCKCMDVHVCTMICLVVPVVVCVVVYNVCLCCPFVPIIVCVVIIIMALLREGRFEQEEVLVWCRLADGIKPNRDLHVFPQRLLVTVSSLLVSEWSQFFCLPFWLLCWPFIWFQRKWWPGSLYVASSCEWLLVFSTDCNRCCKWRGILSKCLCIVSEARLCHYGQWTVFHIARSLVGDGLPTWIHVLPNEAVFWGAWPRWWWPGPSRTAGCWVSNQ